MQEHIVTEVDGKVLTVTLNRPEALNALNPAAHHRLDDIFNAFAADRELEIAIVTGTGARAFCAGYDLKSTASSGSKEAPLPAGGFGGLTSRFDLYKPVIAAVEGIAFGGGFEMALACDLIVASTTALFALPEPLVGLVAEGGGVHRLSRMIPTKQAMGLLITGRRVTAAEGLQMGFVNEVVPAGEALAAARVWAEQIMKCSPMAVRATKQMALASLTEASLERALNADYSELVRLHGSRDYVEGPKAFAEKRLPVWTPE